MHIFLYMIYILICIKTKRMSEIFEVRKKQWFCGTSKNEVPPSKRDIAWKTQIKEQIIPYKDIAKLHSASYKIAGMVTELVKVQENMYGRGKKIIK